MTLKTREQLEAYFPHTARTTRVDQADMKDLLNATPLRESDDDPLTVQEVLAAAGAAALALIATSINDLNLGTASQHAATDFVLSSSVTTVGGQLITAVSAAAGRTALALGDIATHAASEFQVAGDYATNTALSTGLAAKADLASPTLTGTPHTPTFSYDDADPQRIASLGYVQSYVNSLSSMAIDLTGTPHAPTTSANNNSTRVATTAYADGAVSTLSGTVTSALALKAPLASPALSGAPTAPTASALTNSTQIASTAYADSAVSTLSGTVTTALALKAPLASPALTGAPTAPTQSANDNSTKLATTAYADTGLALKANLASPTLTGTPLAPTAAGGTNTTQIATTAFVATSFAPLASPALTGHPTGVTELAADSSTRLATTANVDAKITALALPTASKSKPDAMQLLRNSVQATFSAFDISRLELRPVANFTYGSDHFFSIPTTTGHDLNFQGAASKSKMSFGMWFEFRDSSANTGGAESGAGLNADRTLFANTNRAASAGASAASTGPFAFLFPSNSRMDAYIDGGSGFVNVRFNQNTVTITLVAGKWYFLYVEYDGNGTQDQDKLKIWIDGVALVLNTPTGTTLPALFKNQSAGVFCFGRGVFSTGTTTNFDGRMCNAFCAQSLLGGASVATACLNNGLPLTTAQLIALYPSVSHSWEFGEVSTRMTAFDSVGTLHLTRQNSVGYAQQIKAYTDPYSGLRFISNNPIVGDLTQKIRYEPDYEPSGKNLTLNVPGIRGRMVGDRATPGTGGRGLHCLQKDWCKKSTGIIAYKMAWNVIPTSEAWAFYSGSYVEGHIQDMWILTGVWGTTSTGGGAISLVPFRFDTFYLGGSSPQAAVTTTVSGSASGLLGGNYSVVLGTPYTLYAGSENVSTSGSGSTQGPYVAIVNSTLGQTLYTVDGSGGTPAPNGFFTLLEGRDVLGILGDASVDATIEWLAVIAPMVSANDKATILEYMAALP